MTENRAVSSMRQHWTDDAVTKVMVPVTSLDRSIERFGAPSYCKIDVEGWEFEVLRGLTQRIPLVSIEYHLTDREVEVVRQCLERLQEFGDLRINITTAEVLAFTQPEWLSAEQFLRIFPSKFLGDFQYRYGDIFVRTL
jgi:hypothetical protein